MLTLRPDEISHKALQTWIDLQVREDEDFARAFVRFVTGRSHCPEVCDLSGGNRDDLEKTIADLEAEANDLQREVDKATDEAADLETDLRKAERDRDAAEDEADALRKERDALLAGDPDGALALEALEEARRERDWVRGLAPSWAERLRAIAADLDRKGARKDRAISGLRMLAGSMEREAAHDVPDLQEAAAAFVASIRDEEVRKDDLVRWLSEIDEYLLTLARAVLGKRAAAASGRRA